MWLGNKYGYLTDWTTQQWVRLTGQRVKLSKHAWLDGPVGKTRLIGKEFFTEWAKEQGLELVLEGPRGLVQDFRDLEGSSNELGSVAPAVKHFYEQTSEYELDAWSEWCGLFRPFGRALAVLFSRRLQQLNVPLSALDTSGGITSEVIQLRDPRTGKIVQTGWTRELLGPKSVLYVGSYSTCMVPGYPDPCVKVVFPLPNGNAIVIMKPEAHSDGSFSVTSSGKRFGDPGFYFVVHGRDGFVWARYLRSVRETIRVYAAERETVRADHVLQIWGAQFLRLHYRLRIAAGVPVR
jgi:hypothetical protein